MWARVMVGVSRSEGAVGGVLAVGFFLGHWV